MSTIDASIGLRYIQGLVTPDEAARLVDFCDSSPQQRWATSLTRARQAGRDDAEAQPGRTSESCPLLFSRFYAERRELVAARSPDSLAELDLTWALTQRFAALLGVDVRRLEPLQLVRYAPGAEYAVHHDHTGWYKEVRAEERAEVRAMTLLLFLAAPDGGGELHFPELEAERRVRPRAGDAVVWSNLDEHGAPSRLALHAGLPVTSGRKVVANVWVAEQPFLRMPRLQ